jgi:serine/threonine protein kinase
MIELWCQKKIADWDDIEIRCRLFISNPFRSIIDFNTPFVFFFLLAACSNPPTCYLVMELCRGGALQEILADKNRQLPWDIRIGFAIDVAKGLGTCI